MSSYDKIAYDFDKNLETVTNIDDCAERVFEHCAQASLYNYSTEKNVMVETEIIGPLFIYERIVKGQPHNVLLIICEKTPTKHFEALIDELQNLRYVLPYITTRHKDGPMHGIIVPNEEDRDRVFKLLERLWSCGSYGDEKEESMTESDSSPFMSASGSTPSSSLVLKEDKENSFNTASSSSSGGNIRRQQAEGDGATAAASAIADDEGDNGEEPAVDGLVDGLKTDNDGGSSSQGGGGSLKSKTAPLVPTTARHNDWMITRAYTTRNATNSPGGFMRGLCGLQNLGNTCFMNSALQCLSNVPELTDYFLKGAHTHEINQENPLGTGGQLVKEYADLLKDMWSGEHSSVRPYRLKCVISQFAPRFTGHAQHDSQELTAFLLDGLHEDLNRIKQKPYVEDKEVEAGKDEAQAADQAWQDYRKRNDSIIVDTLHGQHKSTLTCNVCHKISIKFEPFCFLSVPIPAREQRVKSSVIFVRAEKWAKFAIAHTTKTTAGQVKQVLHEELKLPSNMQVVMLSYTNGDLVRNDSAMATSYANSGAMFIAFAVETGPVMLVENFFGCSDAPFAKLPVPLPAKLTRRAVLDEVVPRVRELYLRVGEDAATVSSCSFSSTAAIAGSSASSLSSSSMTTPTPNADDESSSSSLGPIALPPPPAAAAGRSGATGVAGGRAVAPQSPAAVASDDGSGTPSAAELLLRTPTATGLITPVIAEGDGSTSSPEDITIGAAASPRTPLSITNETNVDDNIVVDDPQQQETIMMDTGEDTTASAEDIVAPSLPLCPAALVPPTPVDIGLVNAETRSTAPFPKDEDEEIPLQHADAEQPPVVQLVWSEALKDSFTKVDINVIWELVDREVNMTQAPSSLKKCYSLKECIELYTQQEQLNQEDSWYCPRCKDHRRAFKKLDLWKLPQILVIHLKRFIYSRYTRDKIETELEIPVRGLDLGDKVLNPVHSQEKYDLIGISNHSGGLGSGHYTAYALLNGTEWCEFNDSSAHRLNHRQPLDMVASREAYMLVYRRRNQE